MFTIKYNQYQSAEELIDDWLEHSLPQAAEKELETIKKITNIIQQDGNEKPNEYILMGLETVDHILAFKPDQITVVTAIVYPYYLKEKEQRIRISHILSAEENKLLSSINKMETLHTVDQNSRITDKNHKESIRKMLLAMVDNINAIIIKLAQQIVSLRHIQSDSEEASQLAQQIINIEAPLANQLGIGQLKWKLEDIAFRTLNPDRYFEISKRLKLKRSDREDFILRMKREINQIISQSHIKNIIIQGRAKHIYSIYKKLERKNISINQLYDSIALRILVDSIKDCYSLLGYIHQKWQPIQEEFDDYIAHPKPNGYQSLHTAILVDGELAVEIQLRTHKMHQESELGVAAHWAYKEQNKSNQDNDHHKIKLLRSLIDTQLGGGDKNDEHWKELFADRIYVLTKNKDIIDLPAGSTSLDLAYQLHTELGHRCTGTKINNKLEPLNKTLLNADQVELITKKDDHPSQDWLNEDLKFITTPQAKRKVRQWFLKQRYTENLKTGIEIWDKASRKHNLSRKSLELVLDQYPFENTEQLLVKIGCHEIPLNTLINKIKDLTSPEEKKSHTQKQFTTTSGYVAAPNEAIIVDDQSQIQTSIAKCCQPIPGDEIIGYITSLKGITIHQAQCNNILFLPEFKKNKLIEVKWNQNNTQINHSTTILITAKYNDKQLNHITQVLSKQKLKLLTLSQEEDYNKQLNMITLTTTIQDTNQLHSLMDHLQTIEGVTKVTRKS